MSIIELRKSKGYQTKFQGSFVKTKKIQVNYLQKWVKAIQRKKSWWERPNILKKHIIKLQSHENSSIEFANLDITEIPTLLVLNHKLYRTTTRFKRFCVNLKNIVNNRKATLLLKSFLKTSELRQAKNDWIKINQKKFEDNKLKDLKRELSVIVDN